MEYLDFSSVITTIRKFISDAHNMNQLDLMYDLFVSFLSDEKSLDFTFDNGLDSKEKYYEHVYPPYNSTVRYAVSGIYFNFNHSTPSYHIWCNSTYFNQYDW